MGGIVIGMDEAGYGPNLGPLVITATVWETPSAPALCTFWDELKAAIRNEPGDDERLFVADSKSVYQPSRGVGELEQSVLCLLALTGHRPANFRQLRSGVANARAGSEPASDSPEGVDDAPWYEGDGLELPLAASPATVEARTERLSAVMQSAGFTLQRIACDVVTESRFNRLIATCGNKAAALTERSLRLLRSVWPEDDRVPVCVHADKHGGRNQYAGALSHIFEGRMPLLMEESTACSRYRLGESEISFRAKGESHLPVAVASMVSKYVREVAMTAFNRYWQRHQPDLKATAGYPLDAKRFRCDIATTQRTLGIPDDVLWRCR